MSNKDTPIRRVLDWCMVLCILVFTITQLFSHYSFGRKYLEFLDFSYSQNKSSVAAYDYLRITNMLTSDINQYVTTGDVTYINHYFSVLESSEHQDLLTYFLSEESELYFPDAVGHQAEIISNLDMHILKLAAVANNIPDYQMEEKLRSWNLTDEEKELSSEQQIQLAQNFAFSKEYREAKLCFAAALNEYEENLMARNNVIRSEYAELITTRTRIHQTMLILSGVMMLLVIILLYRQMMTINTMLVNEQQYKGALITDAFGVFEVNLTEDRIEGILSEKDKKITDELKRLNMSVPCSFSEFITNTIPSLPPADAAVFERFSPAYFINQYNNGNRFITRETWYTSSDERHLYLRNTVLLSKQKDSGTVFALIVFRDITAEKLEYEKQRQLMEISLRSGQQYLDALRTDSVGIYETNITLGTIDRIISDTPDHKIARFFEENGFSLPCKVANFMKVLKSLADDENRGHLISLTSEEFAELYKRGVRNQMHELWITMTDGSKKYLKNTMLLRKEEGSGDLIGIVIIRDDTVQQLEKEKRQLELVQQKANNEAKVKFFSRMSHDIRTPLNGVIGMLDLIRHHMDEPERIREYIEKIDQSSRHLLSLVNDVLDMSVIDSGQVEIEKKPLSLKSVLDECCVIVNSQLQIRDIALVVEEQPIQVPVVLGDPIILKKILMNILGNAVKFTDDGGRILFKIEYSYSFDGTTVITKYTIADTGIGMSDEFQKKLFEPFTQEKETARTHYQGTGLGMPIVKQYVDALGGEISVTSKKQEGSTFVVTIPFEIDSNNPDGFSDSNHSRVDVRDLKVLLVDDNELNIEIVQMLLEDQGTIVTTASDGRKALDIFTEAEDGYFDAIIMDIMMPIMDGIEATKAIRRMAMNRHDAASIPIIALTANAFSQDIEKTAAAGMTAHLSKPIVPGMLMETLTRCCRGI